MQDRHRYEKNWKISIRRYENRGGASFFRGVPPGEAAGRDRPTKFLHTKTILGGSAAELNRADTVWSQVGRRAILMGIEPVLRGEAP